MFIDKRNKELDFTKLQSEIAMGSEAAFVKLYDIFKNRLQAFSYSMVHSKEIAGDVVEDVFVKIWTSKQNLLHVENLAVYLYVSVKNQSLTKLSQKAKNLVVASYDTLEPSTEAIKENPYAYMVNSEMIKNLNHAIDSLPPRCKMIFKLIREDGLRYKEVSEILNISINTIDVQMAIAVKRISEALQFDPTMLKNSLKKVKNR